MKNDKCVIASGQSKAATCGQRSNPEGCEGFSPKQSYKVKTGVGRIMKRAVNFLILSEGVYA
jgi:hypothetical protein